MYKTDPLPNLPLATQGWPSCSHLIAMAILATTGSWAGAQERAAALPAAPAAQAIPAAQPMAVIGPENAEQMGQAAAMIARLRQQQAVVEAQVALAKATAELARAQQSNQPASVGAPEAGLAALMAPPRRSMRLLGVAGSPDQRVATLEMSDGVVREVRAGAAVGAWTVHAVNLSEVVLVPRARGGTRLTLIDDGTIRETPYTAPARPATTARRSQP